MMMYKRSKCRAWSCDDLEILRESALKSRKKNIRQYYIARKYYISHKILKQESRSVWIIADPSETQYPRAIGWI